MSPFAAEALAKGLCVPTRDPVCTAVFCGIDGMLAPVVDRADDAQAPGAVSRLEKGIRCATWPGRTGRTWRSFGASDVTGLDVSVPDGRLDSAVRVGVRLAGWLRDMVMPAGVVGLAGVLEGQLRAAR